MAEKDDSGWYILKKYRVVILMLPGWALDAETTETPV